MAGRVLHDEARKACEAVGLICTIAGQPPITIRDELFGEFWIRTGMSFPEPRAVRTVGILQFTLYARCAEDHQRACVIANQLKNAFQQQSWKNGNDIGVITGLIAVRELKGFHVGRRVMIVDGTFDLFQANNWAVADASFASLTDPCTENIR